MFIALKIAKLGYFNGDPEQVLDARVDTVLAILHFESFQNDYDDKYVELNKDDVS